MAKLPWGFRACAGADLPTSGASPAPYGTPRRSANDVDAHRRWAAPSGNERSAMLAPEKHAPGNALSSSIPELFAGVHRRTARAIHRPASAEPPDRQAIMAPSL